MEWNAVVSRVTPYIFKIETQEGHGTGFLCYFSRDKKLYGIATARHVVVQADNWQQPIRLHHFPTKKTAFLKESERVILADEETDSTVILVPSGKLDLPKELIDLLPTSTILDVGTEVGWLGYPGITPHTLCFFSGSISAREGDTHSYLLDGVAINGVSGGPVVYTTPTHGVRIVGTISAYIGNQATPGLAIARDVSHFHSVIDMFRTMDEARAQKEKQAQEQKAKPEIAPALPAQDNKAEMTRPVKPAKT